MLKWLNVTQSIYIGFSLVLSSVDYILICKAEPNVFQIDILNRSMKSSAIEQYSESLLNPLPLYATQIINPIPNSRISVNRNKG